MIVALLFMGCSDALDETPLDFVAPENFFQNESEAKASVLALYNSVIKRENYSLMLPWMVDYTAPGFDVPRDSDQTLFYNFSFDPTFNVIFDFYVTSYEGISKANTVLTYVPEISSVPQDTKDVFLGEARFIRALHYFHLVRLFGDVPLITEVPTSVAEAEGSPRVDFNQIYDEIIIPDLEFASNALPDVYESSEAGRATKGAALGLLSKVYLTRKNYALAREKAKEVMDNGNYGLVDDFRDVFDQSTKNTKEHLFSGQFLAFRVSNLYPTAMSPGETTVCGIALGTVNPEFYDAFPDSYRKDISIITEFEGTTFDGPQLGKYIDFNGSNGCWSSDNNFPILRYADVLLMFAEAENELNGPTQAAYDAVNSIRARARGEGADPNVILPDLEGLSQDEFRQAVYDERVWELCFEAHGWFDLVRTDRLASELENAPGRMAPDSRFNLFPIPQQALDRNPQLTQNDGY